VIYEMCYTIADVVDVMLIDGVGVYHTCASNIPVLLIGASWHQYAMQTGLQNVPHRQVTVDMVV